MAATMKKASPKKLAEFVENSISVYTGISDDGGTLIYVPYDQNSNPDLEIRVECEED